MFSHRLLSPAKHQNSFHFVAAAGKNPADHGNKIGRKSANTIKLNRTKYDADSIQPWNKDTAARPFFLLWPFVGAASDLSTRRQVCGVSQNAGLKRGAMQTIEERKRRRRQKKKNPQRDEIAR